MAKRSDVLRSDEFAAWRNYIAGQRLEATLKSALYAYWDAKYLIDRFYNNH